MISSGQFSVDHILYKNYKKTPFSVCMSVCTTLCAVRTSWLLLISWSFHWRGRVIWMELFKRGSFKGSFSIGATQRMSLRWGNSKRGHSRGDHSRESSDASFVVEMKIWLQARELSSYWSINSLKWLSLRIFFKFRQNFLSKARLKVFT